MIVFDDIMADIETNEKLCPIVIEFFLRGRKVNVSLVLISKLLSKYLKL